jgi:hypothetical protein
MLDCAIIARRGPAVQSWIVTESGRERVVDITCTNSEGQDFAIVFRGFGAGLEVSAFEGMKITYIGAADDVYGTYYGARVAASVLFGVNTMFAGGNKGFLAIVGVDALAVGADVSLLKIYIGKDRYEIEKRIQDEDSDKKEAENK